MSGMDMGQLGTSMIGMTPSTEMMGVGHGIDPMRVMSMASMMDGIGGQGQQQAPMMQSAPAPQLQAGGGQFAMPYQPIQPYQPRPTSQALSGLLGGVYGAL